MDNSPGFDATASLASSGAVGSTSDKVLDFYVHDDESAVLLHDKLLRLGPIATAIVQSWTKSPSVKELATELEARFGAPADVDLTAAVEEQLSALAEYGIIDRA